MTSEEKVAHRRARWARNKRNHRLQHPEMQKLRMARFKAKQEAQLVSIAGRPRADQCELCGCFAKTVFDHDHATGKFRGWLCHRCNRTLGQVKDSTALLDRMIQYLMKGGLANEALISSAKETQKV